MNQRTNFDENIEVIAQPESSIEEELEQVDAKEVAEADKPATDSKCSDFETAESESLAPSDDANLNQFNNDFEKRVLTEIFERKPYHERHYLLYCGDKVPESIDINGTRDFLVDKGFGNGSLKQAREGKRLADLLSRSFEPNKPNAQYCDFCGIELIGTEFDILHDGRVRCPSCTRTALKKLDDYKTIYKDIIRNLQAFFGIQITSDIDIEVLNSKKLHAKIGQVFVPSLKPTPRTLGFACKNKNGEFSICLENGSPRIAAIMAMVHELTHIWQYENWQAESIKRTYGAKQELEVYEGMAKWVEIQYVFLIGESATAIRSAISTLSVDDEYGRGLKKYSTIYPLSEGTRLEGLTPFNNKQKPL